MTMLLKFNYKFKTFPIKFQLVYFVRIDNMSLKFTYFKGQKVAETILETKNKSGRLTFLDFKTYYRSTEIKSTSEEKEGAFDFIIIKTVVLQRIR